MRSYIPPATLNDPELWANPLNSTYALGTDPYTGGSMTSNITLGTTTTSSMVPGTMTGLPVKDPSLLATLPDFRVFGRLFDVMFVLAALCTGVWRYVGNKLNGPDEFGTVYHH